MVVNVPCTCELLALHNIYTHFYVMARDTYDVGGRLNVESRLLFSFLSYEMRFGVVGCVLMKNCLAINGISCAC